MKPERWGSPLVQEKYREEKACDKRHPYRIIIIIIINLKLLGRNENDLENEMKIVQTISKDINRNFGLENCARICLKMHVGSTFENDIKKLDPRKVYKYLGIEKSFDIQHKNEKEKLKKEYLRRLRLVLSTE